MLSMWRLCGVLSCVANTCACAAWLFRVSSLLHARVCFSERECVWTGEEMTGGQVEWRLLSLTQHLSHFIIKPPVTNSSANRQRWGGQEKSCDESGGGHLDAGKRRIIKATCVCHSKRPPYMMQSSVGHIQTCRGSATAHATPLLHLADSRKEVFGDNNRHRLWHMK